MPASQDTQAGDTQSRTGATPEYDALIIGAGISGMYQLHRLRDMGLRVLALEAGTGVGGTWYWNRYPGARFDSESYSYAYSFSKETAGGMGLDRAFRAAAGDAALPEPRRGQIRPAQATSDSAPA